VSTLAILTHNAVEVKEEAIEVEEAEEELVAEAAGRAGKQLGENYYRSYPSLRILCRPRRD